MSYSNYDDVLGQLRSHGLLVDALEIDTTRPVRCKTDDNQREKRGWYLLASMSIETEQHIIGAFGIWNGNDNGKQPVVLQKDKISRLTPEQREAQKAQQKEAKRKADYARKHEADKAADMAKKAWKQLSTTGQCDYLAKKQVSAFGLRYSNQGSIVVPMQDETGSIRGLQFIMASDNPKVAQLGRNKQFWPAGLQSRGTFHMIGPEPKTVLLVAEGYATAASLHQATGYPCAVVWSANNILPACQILHAKHRRAKILICADNDTIQKCSACGKYTDISTATCTHCGEAHGKKNAGVSNAEAAALAVSGSWVTPEFSIAQPADKKGMTDFNDLHCSEGLPAVRWQIMGKVESINWLVPVQPAKSGGEGEAPNNLASMLHIEEALDRFSLVYGGKSTMFDHQEHVLVPKADVLDILPEHGWRDMRAHKRVVRLSEVGFDPAGTDKNIKCNLWGGWPTKPVAGSCENLLALLEYLCSGEEKPEEIYQWVLKWLAFPIQNPGAKMRTSLVFHGPQGTGKNLFFESIMAIYGEYGRIIDQSAIEDKFNDWASKKLFMIADEVVARSELYHIKNKIKSFVTGEWIRINPKNVTAHDEKNHVNIVFLSNEAQPLNLDKDDRRFVVVHTPEKLDESFYRAVNQEIKNGGIPALHHHVLNVKMDNFDAYAAAPHTKAKKELIEVGLDSVSSFLRAWKTGELENIPFCPCLGTHLFKIYCRYCETIYVKHTRNLPQFIGDIRMVPRWKADTFSTWENSYMSSNKSRKMVVPPDDLLTDHKIKPEQAKGQWLAECYETFKNAAGIQ